MGAALEFAVSVTITECVGLRDGDQPTPDKVPSSQSEPKDLKPVKDKDQRSDDKQHFIHAKYACFLCVVLIAINIFGVMGGISHFGLATLHGFFILLFVSLAYTELTDRDREEGAKGWRVIPFHRDLATGCLIPNKTVRDRSEPEPERGPYG